MTSRDALVANRLSQWLGDGAAEINGQGLAFAEVDRLALAAVETMGQGLMGRTQI